MAISISSLDKTSQPLTDTPAAVFVISAEDIRRAGVTSVAEALRMAPGVQVARISSSKWAVSSRGFNGLFASKLLVMIDGRTVYSPLYSGTYWDMQQVLLEDIDRIEVICGPGGAIWGANAVNGIINIITRPADSTQGGLARIAVGTGDTMHHGLRYGGAWGANNSGRVYLTYGPLE